MLKNKFVFIIILILIITLSLSGCFYIKTSFSDDDTLPAAEYDADVTIEENTVMTEGTTVLAETSETDFPSSFNDLSDIISTMTLEQKVAQMILLSCHEDVDVEKAVSVGVGGLCLYGFSFENKTRDEVIDMNNSYQSLAQIPLIISTDEEGGDVNRISFNENLRLVPFWSPSDLYAEGEWELIISDTEEKADLLLSLGVNVNLAPVCDVAVSDENYIYDRTFSLDASETSEYVSTVVSVMKDKGIGSTLKHFPGYGGSVDTHQEIAYDTRDYSVFENNDFLPFKAGITAGADSVLVTHNIVECMDSEMPASLSKNVHDILRFELGFDGVVITDDLVMSAITDFTDGENAAVYAVLAGNDMLCCENYEEAIVSIINAVQDGIIDEAQIDASVKRILTWKANLNLL